MLVFTNKCISKRICETVCCFRLFGRANEKSSEYIMYIIISHNYDYCVIFVNWFDDDCRLLKINIIIITTTSDCTNGRVIYFIHYYYFFRFVFRRRRRTNRLRCDYILYTELVRGRARARKR